MSGRVLACQSRAVTAGPHLPMFPLSTVLFPHAAIPLYVFEPRYRALVDDCVAGDRRLGIVLIARGSEVGGGDERFDVGTAARLESVRRLEDGRSLLAVRGVERIKVHTWHDDRPYPSAMVEEWPAAGAELGAGRLEKAESEIRRVWALLSELGQDAALPSDTGIGHDPETAAWRLCALAPLGPLDRQRLLATPGTDERVAVLTDLVRAVGRDATQLLGGA